MNKSSDSPNTINFAPAPSSLFTGQRVYIERLKDYFLSQKLKNGTSDRRLFLLHGMGGIGKTQICLKFVKEASEQ